MFGDVITAQYYCRPGEEGQDGGIMTIDTDLTTVVNACRLWMSQRSSLHGAVIKLERHRIGAFQSFQQEYGELKWVWDDATSTWIPTLFPPDGYLIQPQHPELVGYISASLFNHKPGER